MQGYKHRVQYYETDKMGVTHHSNYIRMMEEARVFYLELINQPYEKMEEVGIVSPVVSVEFEYKRVTKFAEDVYIELFLRQYNGIKMVFEYVFTNKDGLVVGLGKSKHCFVDPSGKPTSIKSHKEIHEALLNVIEA